MAVAEDVYDVDSGLQGDEGDAYHKDIAHLFLNGEPNRLLLRL